ncbi:hypothetical protein FPHYL_6973 [Fusarium phyllophilum]|uniref:Uncharacterized protein n=1 Tax=Fusarium phyllophilum TaxID=47803 RepID=A0A8H5JS22_9HYPO|nr:hypothetical protein FPHYL_6973 [Fusarium phyllophilum]
MAKVPDDNKIHTVILTLRGSGLASFEAKSNLFKARVEANNPKRFIVIAWCIEYADTTPVGQPRGHTLVTLRKKDLEDLEWSRFEKGVFLDYYGLITVKTYLKRVAWAIDIKHSMASFPGTGDELMKFQYTLYVTMLVVAALGPPKWK